MFTKRVAFIEPKSIWRTLSPVQVNGNARPGNWPGVFISRCYQRVTAIPPPAPALSGSQARLWGPKATITVALVGRKSGRELSDSLVNRSRLVNNQVASGTSSEIESSRIAQDNAPRLSTGRWFVVWKTSTFAYNGFPTRYFSAVEIGRASCRERV